MSHFAVAGLQLVLSAQDNLHLVRSELERLKQRFPWVDMAVLAELSLFGPHVGNAQPMPGRVEESLCQIARELQIWLVPGSIYESDGEHIFNTTPVISPHGEVVARYRKMFPFLPYEKGITPGSEFVVFDVPAVGRFGVSICSPRIQNDLFQVRGQGIELGLVYHQQAAEYRLKSPETHVGAYVREAESQGPPAGGLDGIHRSPLQGFHDFRGGNRQGGGAQELHGEGGNQPGSPDFEALEVVYGGARLFGPDAVQRFPGDISDLYKPFFAVRLSFEFDQLGIIEKGLPYSKMLSQKKGRA